MNMKVTFFFNAMTKHLRELKRKGLISAHGSVCDRWALSFLGFYETEHHFGQHARDAGCPLHGRQEAEGELQRKTLKMGQTFQRFADTLCSIRLHL